jgi:hypothetical protein
MLKVFIVTEESILEHGHVSKRINWTLSGNKLYWDGIVCLNDKLDKLTVCNEYTKKNFKFELYHAMLLPKTTEDNGRKPKSCLGWVFHFKLGRFVVV